MQKSNPRIASITSMEVLAEDVSVSVNIHDTFAVVNINIGDIQFAMFTQLDQVAGIQRNLGRL